MKVFKEVAGEVLGAQVLEQGAAYRVWAPKAQIVMVEIRVTQREKRVITLNALSDGYHIGVDREGRGGDCYRLFLDGSGPYADPVSRGQDCEIDGASMVVDASSFPWTDQDYQRPPFRNLVIYEVHIGTCTPEGTFLAAIERLDHLAELGITAIEIMPIAVSRESAIGATTGSCCMRRPIATGTPMTSELS